MFDIFFLLLSFLRSCLIEEITSSCFCSNSTVLGQGLRLEIWRLGFSIRTGAHLRPRFSRNFWLMAIVSFAFARNWRALTVSDSEKRTGETCNRTQLKRNIGGTENAVLVASGRYGLLSRKGT
jgi:hypothetical protein